MAQNTHHEAEKRPHSETLVRKARPLRNKLDAIDYSIGIIDACDNKNLLAEIHTISAEIEISANIVREQLVAARKLTQARLDFIETQSKAILDNLDGVQ